MGIALLPMPLPVRQPSSHHPPPVPVHTINKIECTCGARAFEEERQRKLAKRVAPFGTTGAVLLRADKHEQDDEMPTRKRSLWRKLFGKGPKCICSERSVSHAKVLQLPSALDGSTTVCVAGKRVPFTREMQRLKRLSYQPLDAIEEDEDYA